MNKFIYLIKAAAHRGPLSPVQMQEYLEKWFKWVNTLKGAHTIIFNEPMEPAGKQISGRYKSVSDTVLANGEDTIIGIFLIKARNLDTAIEIAKGCPIFEIDGGIEVKLIRNINSPDSDYAT